MEAFLLMALLLLHKIYLNRIPSSYSLKYNISTGVIKSVIFLFGIIFSLRFNLNKENPNKF
jgi:hypothetical protein